MKIYLVNESSVVSTDDMIKWVPALKTFTNQVRAYWPRPCELVFVTPQEVPADSWQVVLLDDSDQAGALGYHDYTPGGRPISKVFCKTDKDNGYQIPVTITHEIAEMIADPWISEIFQVSNTEFYAKEVGDPVEADSDGYLCHGVIVSNFVTPAWFIPGHPGPIYDHARRCTKPLQILPGGYMSIYVAGHGWTQVDANGAETAIDPNDARFRPRGNANTEERR